MKIFGHPMSTCTRKVLMTLAETSTAHEFVLVDFAKGEHKQSPHLARQPFGQVPALQDGDFDLYESRAMCRYINDKVGGPLVPRELRDRARMEQWISVETSNFTAPVMKFVFHHIFKREQTPEARDRGDPDRRDARDPGAPARRHAVHRGRQLHARRHLLHALHRVRDEHAGQGALRRAPARDGVVEQDQRAADLAQGRRPLSAACRGAPIPVVQVVDLADKLAPGSGLPGRRVRRSPIG